MATKDFTGVLEETEGVFRWYVMRQVSRGVWEGSSRSRRSYTSESAAASAARSAHPGLDYHGNITGWAEETSAETYPNDEVDELEVL